MKLPVSFRSFETVTLLAERPVERRASARAPSRLTALDGLRGVAALVVVLHHLLLVATPFLKSAGGTAPGSVYWWISETPLKLLSAGSEAVLVFFVLSGLVVALPALNRKSFSWAGFLSGRMVRLYLPVWASLAIGTLLIWLLPRNDSAVTDGTWVDSSNATSTALGTLLDQASLTRASYDVNNVLWSLRWELIFSVLLPLFIVLALVVRRHWAVAIGVAFSLSIVGSLMDVDALRYLPTFFIGSLMAVRLDAVREWSARRLGRPRARLWGFGLVAFSVLAITAGWVALPIAPSGSIQNIVLSQLALLGAAGLVLASIAVRPLRRALDSRGCQWLGRVSFSLYLVHVPIIATLTFLLGDQRWWLVALLTIPVALLVAWGFNRVVERPSHRLARRVSAGVTNLIERFRAGGSDVQGPDVQSAPPAADGAPASSPL
jgi:peptidoglycan/LPS O-acetylase OafA/YrhL